MGTLKITQYDSFKDTNNATFVDDEGASYTMTIPAALLPYIVDLPGDDDWSGDPNELVGRSFPIELK